MAHAWNGPDPASDDAFPTPQEIGTEYRAEVDITITHVRVYTGATELDLANRKARIWSTGGGQLGIATLPNDLPIGWSEHALDTPVERLAAQRFIVSWSTGGNEPFVTHALDSDVPSADGNVTALSSANASGGNSRFGLVVGSFPASASGNAAFFGADVVYTLGIGGNTAPRIQQMTVTAAGAVATATVVAADDETLVGSTTRFVWGDGTSDTVVAYPTISAQRTYAVSGDYAVLATVTDASGATDYDARPVRVVVPSAEVLGLDAAAIFDQVISHALRLGIFEQVNGHEPKSAPGNGLHASVWVRSIRPVAQASGLAITSARLELSIRIQQNMLREPQDNIDPNLVAAASMLLDAYSNDFDLGGETRNVDLLGSFGAGLSADAGYVEHDKKLYRCMVVTLPMILNDVWAQEA